ncbi:hypothetical protein C3F09_11705 [candidate division GN15 bacterium]|uniref:Uncharacterized protein n=1 Tax=candidate division GN15 bacterium TaxID=2072418 RepID=A0A855WV12_9BACT|nr:MAG: hypothetical protein C3F09_11705 [candidate division GN15 bacterium]
MKKLILLILCTAAAVTIYWMSGCNGSSTDSNPKTTGDTTSAEFQTASEVFDLAYSVDGMALDGALDLIGQFVTPAAPRQSRPAVTGDPVFHEGSMYWYHVGTATETTFVAGHPDSILNISEWIRIDSLQFMHLDTPKMIPDPALLTEIKAGVQLDGHALMTDDTVHATRHLQVTGEPGSLAALGDVVINAGGTTVAGLTLSSVWRDTLTVCQVGVNMGSTWQNLALNLTAAIDSGKCPTAGSINWSGILAVDCARGDDSLKFNGQWSASQTHNGNLVTRVFENATTRWTVTDTCGSSAATSPFQRGANPLR